MPPLRPLTQEHGFTVIEVMVAALVLMVGVLGSIALVDRANATTSVTRAREGATNLARELVEDAHGAAYERLTPAGVEAELRDRSGGVDTNGAAAGFTLARRDVTYTVTPSLCSVDEPRDGIGTHPAGQFCPQVGASARTDSDPEDYKQLTIAVRWTQGGRERSVTQTGIVRNAGNASGVAVDELEPSSGVGEDPDGRPVVSGADPAVFAVETSRPAAVVEWSIDGTDKGDAVAVGDGFSFSWDHLGLRDGVYLVGAQAHDAFGRTAGPRFLSVVINRTAPAAPTGFRGGRNGSVIDLSWDASPEGDVIGYSVWRLVAGVETLVSGCGLITATACRDATPPAGDVTYVLRAFDRHPLTGAARPGDAATTTVSNTAPPGNRAPSAPTNLAGTATVSSASLTWTASSDPDRGDSVQFYRVYRDGSPYATTSSAFYTDTLTGGTTHTYYVTAVDTYFAESPRSSTVTVYPPGYTP